MTHRRRYRRLNSLAAPDSWECRRLEHRAILVAMEDRDIEAAVNALAIHYTETFTTVVRALSPDHDPVGLRDAFTALAPAAARLL